MTPAPWPAHLRRPVDGLLDCSYVLCKGRTMLYPVDMELQGA